MSELTTHAVGHELVALVDRWSGYVRARVPACDADDVLQSAREAVLSRAGTYDSTLGEPGAWVFGVVRVTVNAARRVRAIDRSRSADRDVDDNLPATDEGGADPLTVVAGQHADAGRWVRPVAAAATSFEWQVVVEFARRDGSSGDVAEALATRPSTVRAARARVAALARAATAAILARDEGRPVLLEECVPAEGGLAELVPHRCDDEAAAAEALGVSRSTFRVRRALLQRIEALVHEISSEI